MHNRHEHRSRHGGEFQREDDVNWNDRTRGEQRSWQADREFQRSEGYRDRGEGEYGRHGQGRSDHGRWEGRGDEPMGGRGAYGRYGDHAYGGQASRPDDWRSPGAFSPGERPYEGEFGRDYGVNRAYGQGGDYGRDQDYGRAWRATSHAPGAQIWEGSGPGMNRRDYEADYLHWREEQMSKFDRDYDEWRSERRQKFSSDFDTWRRNRADNPIVGDVADGGVGSQKDLKKD